MLFFQAGLLGLLTAVTSANVIRDADAAKVLKCLLKVDVDQLIESYVKILGPDYDDGVGERYLADDFTDSSDTINTFSGAPLGSVTFPSKLALMQHEEQQPDQLVITPVSVGPVGCDSFAFVWNAAGFGAAQLPVRGVTIVKASYSLSLGRWQIETINVEFNGLAFLKNIGGTWTLPSGP